jgi:hypothetical protein
MNKTNDKGVNEGLWCWHTGGSEQGVFVCYYDGIPISDPTFNFPQSSMHGKFSHSTHMGFREELGFMDKNFRSGECINI